MFAQPTGTSPPQPGRFGRAFAVPRLLPALRARTDSAVAPPAARNLIEDHTRRDLAAPGKLAGVTNRDKRPDPMAVASGRLTGGFVAGDNGHPAVAAGTSPTPRRGSPSNSSPAAKLRRVRSIRPPVLYRSSVGPPSLPG
jgi:hypothetical protein